ncbi:ankyrin repeat-containing domain protein [Aspergillus cavernicola]|uniref:Ankyrin repeat-containing domain protein n=1 Tax=Aspergillus cavernicola TaxID=176166 RepID=A0ABR4HG79_9EURO
MSISVIASNQYPLLLAAEKGHTNIVALLLSRNADVHLADTQGRTALSWASAAGKINTMTQLLDAGALPNVADEDGYTPLILATASKYYQALGRSALSIAAGLDLPDIVHLLVDRGADLNQVSRIGGTAISFAFENNAGRAAETLTRAGCDMKVVDHFGRCVEDFKSSGFGYGDASGLFVGLFQMMFAEDFGWDI